MKLNPVPVVMSAALLFVLGVPSLAAAAAGTTTAAAAHKAPTPATQAKTAAYLAAHPAEIARANNAKASAARAKSSSFERQPLDQKAFANPTKTPKASSGGAGSVARMLFGLLVVGGLIYAIHFLLKRWGKARANGGVGGSSGVIDVVATTQLAQGRSVHLIRVGGEVVLVGATEQSITRLGEIDPRGLGLAGIGTPETGNFGSLLRGAIDVGPGSRPVPLAQLVEGPSAAAAASTNSSFVGRFVDNLKLNTAR